MSAKQQAGTGVKLKQICPECEEVAFIKTTLILDFSKGKLKRKWRHACESCLNKET